MKRLVAVDTETTGLDFWHGARPFFVTSCDSDGNQVHWEWKVDPRTREPIIPSEDISEIQSLLDDPESTLVFHNAKFDLRALSTVGVRVTKETWERVHDSVVASHLINSSERHDLTSLALRYLAVDLRGYDERLIGEIRSCRKLIEREYPDWMILDAGVPWAPSSWSGNPPKLKNGSVKSDSWILRAIHDEDLLRGSDCRSDPNLLVDYANSDSAATVELAKVQLETIRERGLERIFAARMRQLPVIYRMEDSGVSVSRKRLTSMKKELRSVMNECSSTCISLSRGHLEEMPTGGRSKKLEAVLFGEFGLTTGRRTKKGGVAMDKFVLEDWANEVEADSDPGRFIESLRKFRKRQTALSFLESYERFWVQSSGGVYLLHPSVHMTGTSTLRTSSENPNEQQISGQEEANVRSCFGPGPGREWWSLDYENIELRIPAYESGESELIDLFERSDEPPFYGSEHLLNFSVVYPDIWTDVIGRVGIDRAGPWIKENYKTTWYKWVKNGDFAVGYGAIDRPGGTADKAFRRPGSHARLKEKFSRKEALNRRCIEMAERLGYVETLPDKDVDPDRGYPLVCPRGEYGRISPTIPLNYMVQGTACWVVRRATVEVSDYLDHECPEANLIMDVHDELVLDLPFAADRGNEPIVRGVQKKMESMGDCIGVPLRVGISYHPRVWSKSE